MALGSCQKVTSPFAPASPSCYLPVPWELTWVFEVLGNRYCLWCTQICQECMARNKKVWLFSFCRVLMSVYQLRSCKWGGWAESLFCWRTGIQLRKGFRLQKRDSHPVPGLVGSSKLLGCLTAWLHPQEELGQPGITQFVAPLSQAWGFPNYQLPHCSPEGSRHAFWRYLIFACVSFPVCFPLTGAVSLTPDASV